MKNRNWLGMALVSVAALAAVAHAAESDCLIISEVVDGPVPVGSPCKFVELTNTGTTSIDLSEYTLGNINNGEGFTNYAATALSGILHPGESYICAYAYDDYPGNGPFFDVFGFDPDNFNFGSWINGNDVLVLYYGDPGTPHDGSTAIDIYGVVGVDGTGEVWEYTDGYAYRNSTVVMNNSTFTASEWTFGGPLSLGTEQDMLDFTTPGAHTFSGSCGTTDPTGRCCVDPYFCYVTTSADCSAMGGTWTAGLDCDGNPCGTPPAEGACCYGETCVVSFEADCTGDYQGDGTFCVPNPCITGCTTIPEAKGLPLYSDVLLCNVVVSNVIDTVGSGGGAAFHVQEQTGLGGITIYGTQTMIDDMVSYLFEGDLITIQGQTDAYNGLFELTDPFSFDPNDVVFGTGERPDPVQVTGQQLSGFDPNDSELYESMYVEVPCATYVDTLTPTWYGYENYMFNDGTANFTVRVPTSDTDLQGESIPTGVPVRLRGIFSQYGGYQLLMTRGGTNAPDYDNPQGDVYIDPLCLAVGACCLPPTFTDCIVTDEADCTSQNGIYQGGGTRCTPFNPCLGPMGACCKTDGTCEVLAEADCIAVGGGYQGDNTLCGNYPCAVPVEAGDVALGTSTSDQYEDGVQIRAGAQVGSWNSFNFLQSMEFDNAGGTLHNAQGNLLTLNYGAPLTAPDPGGKLYNLATDGTSVGEVLFNFDGTDQGNGENALFKTRITGLGVSPNNQYLGIWGSDLKFLYVLEYDAGSAIGSGTGASITDSWYASPGTNAGGSQSITWIDDDTLLVGLHTGSNDVELTTFDFDPSTGISAGVLQYDLNSLPSAGQFTDVEYNPNVSPYVFVLAGNYGSGTSTTYLAVIDPHLDPADPSFGDPWSLVTTVDMSSSSNTGRECALGQDGYLYWSQYHSGAGTPFIDRVDVSNPAAITPNSSVDYFSGDTYSSYNGMDIAHAPAPSGCPGDCDCDGDIDYFDINYFLQAINGEQAWIDYHVAQTGSAPTCTYLGNCDVDQDGSVDYFDINPFLDAIGTSCP